MRRRIVVSATYALLSLSGCASEEAPERNAIHSTAALPATLVNTSAVFAYVDMEEFTLHFYEPSLDKVATVDLRALPGYGGGAPLHAYITDAGRKVYVAYNGDLTRPTGLSVIRIRQIDWTRNRADVSVLKDLVLDHPARPNTFPPVVQVDPIQPFQPWTAQPFTQLHGPERVLGTNKLFWTVLTDDRVVTVDTKTDTFLEVTSYGEGSRWLHGIAFNPSARRAFGAGYFYDLGFLPAYRVSEDQKLSYRGPVWLGTPQAHAAFVHDVEWVTDRYAVVGTMQFGRTSLTPPGQDIIGPSVWLVDARLGTAWKILGSAPDADSPGVFRSSSWIEVVGKKLFVAEEDSLDATFGDDGYLAVYDFRNRLQPRLLKRLKPGVDFPSDFSVAHAMEVTPDRKSVILESYVSGYVIRVGVESLEAEYVIKGSMPHGGSIVSVSARASTMPGIRTNATQIVETEAPSSDLTGFSDGLPEDDE